MITKNNDIMQELSFADNLVAFLEKKRISNKIIVIVIIVIVILGLILVIYIDLF